ncbi:MAG: hypothetical protein ACRDQZ_03915, partial [Mycobacteriales bacterium]
NSISPVPLRARADQRAQPQGNSMSRDDDLAKDMVWLCSNFDRLCLSAVRAETGKGSGVLSEKEN